MSSADPRVDRRFIRSPRAWLLLAVIASLSLLAAPELWGRNCRSRARSAMTIRHYLAAASWLDSAAKWQPADGRTEFLLARLDRKRGQIESMHRRLERCRQWSVSSDAIEREGLLAEAQAGRLDRIDRQLSVLLTNPQGDLQEICGAYVNGCIANYRLGQAWQIIELWIADSPEDPEPLYLLGRIREHTGRYDDSKTAYRHALALDPSHAPAAYNLARLLLHELDQPEEALMAYRQAAEHLELPQPAMAGAATCLIELQQFDEARRLLDEARALDDTHLDEAYRLVGDPGESASARLPAVYGQLEAAEGRAEAAAVWLEQAVAANPRDWKTRYALVKALRECGRNEDAAEHAQIVEAASAAMGEIEVLLAQVPADPDNADVRCRIGELFLEHVSEQQGIIWLQSALQIDPQHQPAQAALDQHYSRQQAYVPAPGP